MTLPTFCADKNTPCWDTCGNQAGAGGRHLWFSHCAHLIGGFSVFSQQVAQTGNSVTLDLFLNHVCQAVESNDFWQKRESCLPVFNENTQAHAPSAAFWCTESFKSHRWLGKPTSPSLWSQQKRPVFPLFFLHTGQPVCHVSAYNMYVPVCVCVNTWNIHVCEWLLLNINRRVYGQWGRGQSEQIVAPGNSQTVSGLAMCCHQ